jgi:cyclopropane-fatty-acyl-phospholipid synthase
MWEFYLQACEVGFRWGGLEVFQLQLVREIDAVPITRDYIAEEEKRLRESDGVRMPPYRQPTHDIADIHP